MTRRLSIPTRVFLVFLGVMTAFTGVLVFSLRRHQQTAEDLRVLRQGLVPLTASLSELRAAQVFVGSLLSTLAPEAKSSPTGRVNARDSSWQWLLSTRRSRPNLLARCQRSLEQARQLMDHGEDRLLLARLDADLQRAAGIYGDNEVLYKKFDALADRKDAATPATSMDSARKASMLAQLRQREGRAAHHLRFAWQRLQAQVATLSKRVAREEQDAITRLGAATMVALVVGLMAMLWMRSLLQPLKRLRDRVLAVAEGHDSPALTPRRHDEIGLLTQEFEKMLEVLRARDRQLLRSERLAAIGRMAAHVTHEVRNPLSSIALNVDMLRDELKNTSGQELIKSVQAEIDRLHRITEEYLHVGRLPAPTLRDEDIMPMLRDLLRFMETELTQQGLCLEADLPAHIPLLSFDASQIRQALLNLLRNAQEASAGHEASKGQPSDKNPKPGKRRGLVKLAVRLDDRWVHVTVSDNGPGVPKELQNRIFELFFTTKTRGTGLGLSLSEEVAHAHGGRLQCDDAPEGGARFTLSLPMSSCTQRRRPHA